MCKRRSLAVLVAQEPRERVAVTGWQASFVAGLEAGKLLAATPELAEQFDAQRAQAVQGAPQRRAPIRARTDERLTDNAMHEVAARAVTPMMREHLARMKSMVAAFTGRSSPGAVV